MKQTKDQQDKVLGALVAALEHNADRLEEESRTADSLAQRRQLSATARFTSSLAEEIAALAALSGRTAKSRPSHDQPQNGPIHMDLKRAFQRCLDSIALGPIRDHVVRGYLNLNKVLAKFEGNDEQQHQQWTWGRNNATK